MVVLEELTMSFQLSLTGNNCLHSRIFSFTVYTIILLYSYLESHDYIKGNLSKVKIRIKLEDMVIGDGSAPQSAYGSCSSWHPLQVTHNCHQL